MGNTDAATAYRDELLNDIRQQDKPHIKGWIVDLRGNFGGNTAPMLAGLLTLPRNSRVFCGPRPSCGTMDTARRKNLFRQRFA